MIERILGDFERAYGFSWAALRYFNACGADPNGEVGEQRSNESHLIPRAMAALGQLHDFQILGTDYPTAGGTAVRDYIHVTDLASAHVLCLHKLLKGETLRAMNIGTGKGNSIRQVIAEIFKQSGSSFEILLGGRRSGGPAVVADPTLAQQPIGFRTEMSDLQTIISTAWHWHCRNFETRP